MAPNIRRLSYIMAVTQHGSLAEAADKLNVSPSAISVAIKDCEERLGFQIFSRKPSQALTVTPLGRRFLAETRKFLDQASTYELQTKGLTGHLAGRMDLGCFFPLASFLMIDVIGELREKHPDFSIRLHEGDLKEVLEDVKSGVTELALTYDLILDPDVTFEPLFSVQSCVLMSSQNPLAHKKVIKIQDLADQPMVLIDLPAHQAYIRMLFAAYNLTPNIGYQVISPELARNMVGANLGYSFVFLHPVNSASVDGAPLICRPVANEMPTTQVVIARSNQSVSYGATDAIREVCKNLFVERRVMERYLPQSAGP